MDVERWASEHGLTLTPENRPAVRRHLHRGRACRTWGAVAGVLLPSLIDLAFHGRVTVLGFGTDGQSAPLAFGAIFVGYLAGALYAEVSLIRPAGRRASIVRRELEDYLPHRVIVAQRAAAVAGALGALAAGIAPYDASISVPSALALAVTAAFVLAFAGGLEAIERWLVRRPQPFTSPSEIAADDAIRAQSIRDVAGAGLALLLLFCGGMALMLQASDVALARWAMIVPAAVCVIGSLLVFRGIGDTGWRVRRSGRAAFP